VEAQHVAQRMEHAAYTEASVALFTRSSIGPLSVPEVCLLSRYLLEFR
jgi:hypothetical protein